MPTCPAPVQQDTQAHHSDTQAPGMFWRPSGALPSRRLASTDCAYPALRPAPELSRTAASSGSLGRPLPRHQACPTAASHQHAPVLSAPRPSRRYTDTEPSARLADSSLLMHRESMAHLRSASTHQTLQRATTPRIRRLLRRRSRNTSTTRIPA